MRVESWAYVQQRTLPVNPICPSARIVLAACAGEDPDLVDSIGDVSQEDVDSTGDLSQGGQEEVDEASQALSGPHCWDCGNTPACYELHSPNNKCLTTCAGTGWALVGAQSAVGGFGQCENAAAWFCWSHYLAARGQTCWGFWYP